MTEKKGPLPSPIDGTPSVTGWSGGPPRELARTRIFSLVEREMVSPSGATGQFALIQCTDWVNVIALTGAGEVVLIEQFRHGTEEVTVEIPGGMIDAGEDPVEAGLRELVEETGYQGTAEHIGEVSTNPAFLNNRCHTVLVRDASQSGKRQLDELEDIRVRLLPADEIPALIARGTIHHALVVAAFHHLSLWK